MPKIVGIFFNIFEQDKFRAQLILAWKKFHNLGAWLSRTGSST